MLAGLEGVAFGLGGGCLVLGDGGTTGLAGAGLGDAGEATGG